MTFTMTFFERMRRAGQPVEQGRGKSKVFIKNGTPGRSPTQFSSVQFSTAQSSGAAHEDDMRDSDERRR